MFHHGRLLHSVSGDFSVQDDAEGEQQVPVLQLQVRPGAGGGADGSWWPPQGAWQRGKPAASRCVYTEQGHELLQAYETLDVEET